MNTIHVNITKAMIEGALYDSAYKGDVDAGNLENFVDGRLVALFATYADRQNLADAINKIKSQVEKKS